MRKNTRRVLALVMALALILGNFTGLGTTSKAAGISEIFSVTTTVKEFSSQGGNVDITIKGENLGSNVYYRVMAKSESDSYFSKIVKHTAIACPSAEGGTISIPVPENTEGVKRTLRIGITDTDNEFGSYKNATDITQLAAGGQTPTVDKTELENAIKAAEECKQSDYTTETWAALQSALEKARKVKNDSAATEQAVKDATKALNDAIAAGKPAVDDSVIKAKVVDEQGKPLSGIDFELIEEATADTIDIPSSDAKGETKYSVKNAYDGEFTLTIHTTSEYTFAPTKGYTYHVAGGKVTKVTVDGKDYNEEIPTLQPRRLAVAEKLIHRSQKLVRSH